MTLERGDGGGSGGGGDDSIAVEGTVEAVITQACASTLAPFDTTISRPFRTLIHSSSSGGGGGDEAGGIWGSEDSDGDGGDGGSGQWDEEVSVNGVIDLGEIAAQYMALSIDPFARAPAAAASAGQ